MSTCRDFERAWNDRLDARLGPTEVVDDHAARCPSCRLIDARYRALALAIQSPAQAELVPEGFTDRVLAASIAENRPSVLRFRPTPQWAASAAAVLMAVVALGWGAWPVRRNPPEVVSPSRAIDPEGLSDALNDAGSATWELAREASGPAARVGRRVLDSASLPLPLPVAQAPRPSLPTISDGVGPASEVWRRVGDRVSAGAVPLGGTARHAFGFLLGDAPEDDGRPPAGRPAEGA